MRVANILEEGKMGGPQVRILQVAVYLEKHVDTVVVMPQHPKKCFEDDKENINPHSGLNQSTSNNIRRGGGNAGGSKYSRGRKPLQEIYIGEEVDYGID